MEERASTPIRTRRSRERGLQPLKISSSGQTRHHNCLRTPSIDVSLKRVPLPVQFCLENVVIEPQRNCISHSDMISADVQKLCVALRRVHACGPTGVVEGNIFSVALAMHLGELKNMDYSMKDFDTVKQVFLRRYRF